MATLKKIKRKGFDAYQIHFIHPVTKKRIRKTIRCSKKDAEKIVKKIEADIALGIFSINPKFNIDFKWSALKKRYLSYAKRSSALKTYRRIKNVLNAFDAYIENTDPNLVDITQATIENYKLHRLELGRKNDTVALELRHLKAVFNQGIVWKLTDQNPVIGVKHPKKEINNVRYLTLAEVKSLLEAIDNAGEHDFKRAVLVYLHTGARRFEILKPNLTWDDIDFDNKQILFHGKSDKKRYVPLNKVLVDIFQEIKSEGHEYPFEYCPDYYTHRIAVYYEAAKIHGATLHSLRKTFGSVLIQNNIADIYTVSKLLGHSSIRVTEKYYVNLLESNLRDSVTGLEGLI